MSIALLGAGPIGTIIGALLSQGGEDIILVNTNQAHVDALNHNGARIVLLFPYIADKAFGSET